MEVLVEEHGAGRDVIVLLHGMGATGAVWRGVISGLAGRWAGRVIVCDLPGHGGSAALADYRYASIVDAVAQALPMDGPLVLAGHSFGGFLALLLAADERGFDVTAAVATGVKVTWNAEELARTASFAAKPPTWFDSFEQAQERYRRVAGLTPDVTSHVADLARGVRESDGRFRLSHDPASAAVGPPEMGAAVAAVTRPVLLSRGIDDPMVSRPELEAFGTAVADIPGGGHNIHVQQPARYVDHLLGFIADDR